MKNIAFNILAFGALTMALTACDAKDEPIDNIAYINDAVSATSNVITMGKAGEVSTSSITIRVAQPAAQDTKIKLSLDPSVLDNFNRRNATEYETAPAEYVEFEQEAVIPAGSASVEIPVSITAFEGTSGVEYAVPFKLESVQGVDVSQGAGSFVITLGQQLIQKCPQFYYDNAMKMNWDATVTLPNLTLEWWARVVNTRGNGGFTINNQALFAFQSNYELYVRFGDVVYSDAYGRNLYNFLQIKTLGIDANYDSGDPNDKPLPWGKWIHFAHTYDSGSGEVVLYVDGTEVNRTKAEAGKVFEMTGLNMCASGINYFRDYIEMAQVRLWKTTRTADQINKFMNKSVRYTDPNLVFYLPMNEGEGSVLHDVTGNGHDVTIGSADGGSNNQAHAWTEYTF